VFWNEDNVRTINALQVDVTVVEVMAQVIEIRPYNVPTFFS
jgi:hypothetical protein